ncbi:MAG: hypothetical protein QNK77_10270 [Crocinitomicaceae bacterium]|nr:hypothetical protein [Crocinitomicaceae bacterium]
MKTTTLLSSLLGFGSTSFGQVLAGTISDEQGTSLPFTKVWIKNTSFGTIASARYFTEHFKLIFTGKLYSPFQWFLFE